MVGYYTCHVHVEMMDADGKEGNAIAITIADSKSLRLKAPQRHAMSGLQKDSVALMRLPPPPRGVSVPLQQMLPPLAASNPTDGASWIWTCVAIAPNKAAVKSACDYGIQVLSAILDKGFLNAHIDVPPSSTHGAFQISIRIAG